MAYKLITNKLTEASPGLVRLGFGGFLFQVNDMKYIELTQGQYAIVDDWNYEWLNIDKWCASASPYTFYATRSISIVDPDYPRNKDREIVTFAMHTQILNPPEGLIVDHINHNGIDNRECNIRIATRSQNIGNSHKPNIPNLTSQYKGVCRGSGKWHATLGKKHLGVFQDEIDAARAYDKAAVEKWGEFALTNFPLSTG